MGGEGYRQGNVAATGCNMVWEPCGEKCLTGLRTWTIILGRRKFSELRGKPIPEAPPVLMPPSSKKKNSIVSVKTQFSSDRKRTLSWLKHKGIGIATENCQVQDQVQFEAELNLCAETESFMLLISLSFILLVWVSFSSKFFPPGVRGQVALWACVLSSHTSY